MAIIHQHDVVTGIMGLNQIHLEDESLFIAAHDDRIKMIDVAHHRLDFARLGAEEILADPLFEVLGLPDIDDLIVQVLHQIDPGFIGEERNEALKELGHLRCTMVAPPPPSYSPPVSKDSTNS